MVNRGAGRDFGFGPGDEDTGADGQLDVPEGCLAGQMLQRLAGDAAVDQCVIGRPVDGVVLEDVLTVDAEDVRGKGLRVVSSRGNARSGQSLRGSCDGCA
jgi:hypothetical protein